MLKVIMGDVLKAGLVFGFYLLSVSHFAQCGPVRNNTRPNTQRYRLHSSVQNGRNRSLSLSELEYLTRRTSQHLKFGRRVIAGALAEISSRHDRDCSDGDRIFSVGEMFTRESDPCERCLCASTGPQCSVTRCPELSESCIEVARHAGECCVQCVREGCDENNRTYHVGEYFNTSPCRLCKCETNGRAYCSVADCEPPPCIDSIRLPDQCCPVCPEGPNCFAGGRVIPSGQTVLIDNGCRRCRCTNYGRYWAGSDQADCDVMPHCQRSNEGK
nr:von Willebrand factor C domain-containing protein 2-like [Ciona intestinalis]|eukprot:XP_026691205.1 von Willebrand factor C domain-containing protein 2-like [Ciona intestinalis]